MFKKSGSEQAKSHSAQRHDAHHEIKDAKELAAKRAEELLKRVQAESEASQKDTSEGTGTDGGVQTPEEYQKLKKQVEELLQLKDRWIRQAADFENAKKRLQKEKDDFVKFANTNLISGLLPILRDLDRVVHHGQRQNQDKDPLVAGVELVIKQLEKFLESNGVKRIESLGKTFDPHVHEAVNHIASDQPAETIIEETEPGYLYHDRLIKSAKVVVSSGPPSGQSLLEPAKEDIQQKEEGTV